MTFFFENYSEYLEWLDNANFHAIFPQRYTSIDVRHFAGRICRGSVKVLTLLSERFFWKGHLAREGKLASSSDPQKCRKKYQTSQIDSMIFQMDEKGLSLYEFTEVAILLKWASARFFGHATQSAETPKNLLPSDWAATSERNFANGG